MEYQRVSVGELLAASSNLNYIANLPSNTNLKPGEKKYQPMAITFSRDARDIASYHLERRSLADIIRDPTNSPSTTSDPLLFLPDLTTLFTHMDVNIKRFNFSYQQTHSNYKTANKGGRVSNPRLNNDPIPPLIRWRDVLDDIRRQELPQSPLHVPIKL